MSTALGRRAWAFPGGCIPATSTGKEPEFTSREEICVLNLTDEDAHLEMTAYHDDREPVGPYPLTVTARRVRHVRVNDLVDPEAVLLGQPYGLVVHSDVPVVVQLTRVDTRRGQISTMTAAGLPGDA